MNNIFQKVLLATEEFANKSNRLSLAADSILDRIIPKGTASAGCYKYRITCGQCYTGLCPGGGTGGGRKQCQRQKRFCDTPYPYTCANTPHCGAWVTYDTFCQDC